VGDIPEVPPYLSNDVSDFFLNLKGTVCYMFTVVMIPWFSYKRINRETGWLQLETMHVTAEVTLPGAASPRKRYKHDDNYYEEQPSQLMYSIVSITKYPTDSMELKPSREAASCAATQEFPNILWNWRFITAFTRALHWSLSSARSIQSIHPILLSKIHLNIIRPSTSWSSGLFPYGFSTNKTYAFLLLLHGLPISSLLT
jgi:hypothetical protein